jgi:histidyl-tRNA synthetase
MESQDFDIAGSYDPMVPDAEILSILCEALTALDIGEFTVKLNHRKILDGIFELAGVPKEKTRAISSAVDKLDKVRLRRSQVQRILTAQMAWTDVKKEMVMEKGLDEAVADRIGEYVGLKGESSSIEGSLKADDLGPGWEVLEKLEADVKLTGIASAKTGLADMRLLFEYLDIFGVLSKVSSPAEASR